VTSRSSTARGTAWARRALVVQAGRLEIGLQRRPQVLVVREDRDHLRILVAEQELHRPVLRRLEARRLAETIAELGVLDRRERLQHGPLLEHLPLDRLDPGQPLQRRRQVVGRDQRDRRPQLVRQLLEPQLGDLVLDDEQHLVVVVRDGLLRRQQRRQVEIARVRQLAAQVGRDPVLDRPEGLGGPLVTLVHTLHGMP
jgi:hypothetical protein